MTGSSSDGRRGRGSGDSWEQRAADLASDVQRWLIRRSARSMRDELGDQVRKAIRGTEPDSSDVWGTATTEPSAAAGEAPECAWCPVCRAARRIAAARSGGSTSGTGHGNGSVLGDAADVMTTAIKEAIAGLDSILSYRPGTQSPPPSAPPSADSGGQAAEDQVKGPDRGPDDRG